MIALMGYWKNKQEEDWSRGYCDTDKVVCSAHFDDEVLVAAQSNGASLGTCDFCENESSVLVSDLTNVVEVVARTLFEYWNDADNEGIPWDSREGGYQAHVVSVAEAFDDLFVDEAADEVEVWEGIASTFFSDASVCQRNYWELSGEDSLKFDWSEFTSTIKYRTRYVFLAAPATVGRGEVLSATQMLERLADLLEKYGCIRTMPAGERWFRARVHRSTESCSTGADLATVPDHLAKTSNRMSPAGIPMFYGAADQMTALSEVWTPGTRKRVASCGVFRTLCDMEVVDLTSLPQLPGIFATDLRDRRDELLFLRSFIDDLRQPITHDGREHTEYVPTQVVTEYFRRVLKPANGPIGGVLFRSSLDPEATCSVLFADHEACWASGAGVRHHFRDAMTSWLSPATTVPYPSSTMNPPPMLGPPHWAGNSSTAK